MLHGPLTSSLLGFALPVMFSGFLSMSFHAADSLVVGKFAGDAALAAVTSSSPLLNLLVPIFSGLSMGTNVVVARALGRGEEREV
jgi:Na+-driven multidrug efflux pump